MRRQKLADLQAAGHDPFTLTKFPQAAYSADLKEEFKDPRPSAPCASLPGGISTDKFVKFARTSRTVFPGAGRYAILVL